MINLSKSFRGYSYEEVQQKKREWFKRQFERGCYWHIIHEDLKPCIFFGSIKLIVEIV